MTPYVHSGAREELDAAVEYLDRHGHALGDDLLAEWRSGLAAIGSHPARYPLADDAPAGADVRCYYIPRFHYRLLYLLDPSAITVLAFAHASRRPGYWAGRLT